MSTPKKLALAALSFAVTFLVPLVGLRPGGEGHAGANVWDVKA